MLWECWLRTPTAEGDHTKSIPNALKYQLPVYSCQDVADKFKGVISLKCGKKYRIGDFTVQPISVEHNVENYSFVIDHPETGRCVYVTDCVRFPYRLRKANHLLLEANYSNDIVIDHMMNGYNIRSQNQYHMELEDTIECIKNNMSSELNNVVLVHLSEIQSDEQMFIEKVHAETGVKPCVATKGVNITLNKFEF